MLAGYDALGFDAEAALRRLGLTRAQLANLSGLVPAATSLQLLAIASERDATFPLRAGARLPWGEAGLIDYVNGSRATLGAVLESMVRFSRVVSYDTRFAHAAPPWADLYRELLRSRVVCGAPRSGILFSAESLALPSLRRDARLEAIVERHALDVLAKDPATDALHDSVAAAIRAALPEGLPTMRRVARALALSERTLRRRLARE